METTRSTVKTSTLSSEESANVFTHAIGVVMSYMLVVPLWKLALGSSMQTQIGVALFLFGMVSMYMSSTLYHFESSPRAKRILRVLDHSSIYTMIAGSYSPICLGVLGGVLGWTLFGFLWICVIAGVIGKSIALGKHPKLSLLLYLMMGWVALIVIVPMWLALSPVAFWMIIAEGVFYSVGTYFFRKDEEVPYYHAIWHIFILLGTISHVIALVIALS